MSRGEKSGKYKPCYIAIKITKSEESTDSEDVAPSVSWEILAQQDDGSLVPVELSYPIAKNIFEHRNFIVKIPYKLLTHVSMELKTARRLLKQSLSIINDIRG